MAPSSSSPSAVLLFLVLSVHCVTTSESNDEVDKLATLIHGSQHGARKAEIKTASKYHPHSPTLAKVPRTPKDVAMSVQSLSRNDLPKLIKDKRSMISTTFVPTHVPMYFMKRRAVDDQNLQQSKDYDTRSTQGELITGKKHDIGLVGTVAGRDPKRKTVLEDELPRLANTEQNDITTSRSTTQPTNIFQRVTRKRVLSDQIHKTGKPDKASSIKKDINLEKHNADDAVSEQQNHLPHNAVDNQLYGQHKDEQDVMTSTAPVTDVPGIPNEKHNKIDYIPVQNKDGDSTKIKENTNLNKRLKEDILASRPQHQIQHVVKTSMKSSDKTLRKHPSIPNNAPSSHNDNHNVSLTDIDDFIIPPGHADKFRCPPCQCFYTLGRKIVANCTNSNFIQISAVLPKEIWRLNVLGTSMTTFNTSDMLMYPSLMSLSVTANYRLLRVQNSTLIINGTSKMTILDLSGNNINSIDDRSFALMPDLLNLTLKLNKIQTITNFTFEGLCNQRKLDLSLNNLTYLEPGIFDQLQSLTSLHLSRNKFMGYTEKYFPPQIFLKQQKLKSLYIQGGFGSREDRYPNKALGHLTNLQELYVDGINDKFEFGAEMRSLAHFSHLEIGTEHGKCYIKTMKKSLYENLSHLKVLKMKSCPLHYVEEDAYLGARKLKTLSLASMDNYHLFQAFDDLKSLQNSSLKSLAFVHLFHYYNKVPCRILRYNQSRYLRNIELEELDISSNMLSLVYGDFCQNLPKTLKRLVLRNNRFTRYSFPLERIDFLTQLVEIDLTLQNYEDSSKDMDISSEVSTHLHLAGNNNLYCTNKANVSTNTNSQISDNYNELNICTVKADIPNRDSEFYMGIQGLTNTYFSNHDVVAQLDKEDSRHMKRKLHKHKYKYPPNLKVLRAAQNSNFGSYILVSRAWRHSNLEQIDFSANFMSLLGPRYTMPHRVHFANLDGNYLTHVTHTFSRPNSSLQHLSLKNNLLGNAFAMDEDGTTWAQLDRLHYLDLSNNMIFELPTAFFKGLISLRTLILSENRLQIIHNHFSHMTNLRYIDLSKNSIIWISKQSRDDLDTLATSLRKQQQLLQLDLQMNPLPCTCRGLEVLHWMATTNVYLLSKDYLYCRFENGNITEMGDVGERFRAVQRECRSKVFIIFSCVASIIFLGVLVAFAMMYRFRWKLRYLRHTALAKLLGYKPRVAEQGKFKYDAFFLYGEESRRFVLRHCRQELQGKRGHTLCLDEIDFLPGTLSMSNISSAIQNSTKTLVVVTPEFYEDEYAEYGVKMAIMEEIYNKRKLLHLCIHQPISADDMGDYPDLLMLMRRNDYTEYPPEDGTSEEIRQNFWDQLSETIGHTDNTGDLDGTPQQE